MYATKKWPIIKKYAEVELRPPSGSDFSQAIKEAKALITKAQNGAWKELTVYVSNCL